MPPHLFDGWKFAHASIRAILTIRCTFKQDEAVFVEGANQIAKFIARRLEMRCLILLALCIVASGFKTVSILRPRFSDCILLRMSEDTPKGSYEIVPLDKTNIESAAAVTGGVFGLIIGGPVGAAVFAAIANYVSKKDNEAGEAFRGIGKSIIESVNYLRKVDSKFGLVSKVSETIASAAAAIPETETVESVKKTIATVTSKVKEINDEYDLIAKGKEVIVVAGSLSDATLAKVDELNEKYDFVETTKSLATTAVDKIKEQTK